MGTMKVVQDGDGRDNFEVTDDDGNRAMYGTEAAARDACSELGIDWPGEKDHAEAPAPALEPESSSDNDVPSLSEPQPDATTE